MDFEWNTQINDEMGDNRKEERHIVSFFCFLTSSMRKNMGNYSFNFLCINAYEKTNFVFDNYQGRQV